MCGICGIIGEVSGRKNRVKDMVKVMYHRGPDDSGIADLSNLTFGMTRLAILDLSSKGHQPMSNRENNLHIVYNGEMYNFKSERQILITKGYKFKSESDTEVVLSMYQEYGVDFLARIRGMFALAIFDQRKGEKFILARDQLGIKPLLFTENGQQLVFASELKSILKSGLIKKEVDSESLRLLLTFGSILQPGTMIKNVKMLLPGHFLVWANGVVSIKKYWQLGTNRYPQITKMSYKKQVKAVRQALEESVKIQMVSDAPLGAFLSGGIDSSLLVALMAKNDSKKIKTFSIGFDKAREVFDETDEAAKIAKFIGTDHHKVIITSQEISKIIKQIAKALDQPSVDGANAFFVAFAAKKEVTVAISGTGGDELFAGYPWFANMARFVQEGRPKLVSRFLSKLFCHDFFNYFALSKFTLIRRSLEMIRREDFLPQFARQYQIFNPWQVASLMAKTRRKEAKLGREPALDIRNTDELAGSDPVNRVSSLCLRGYTQNQLLRDIDATSMYHSLEVRVPFIDPILTDIALSLPVGAKLNSAKLDDAEVRTYRSLGAKKILIDIARDLLPKDIDLQPKRGFTLPFNDWLQGELSSLLKEILSSKVVKNRGFFDVFEVEKLYKGFLLGKVHWTRVWLLMMTELWAREVLDS